MKTTILRTEKSSRWAAILLATVVGVITSAVVANATQTITTPNAAFVSYNLASGGNSAAITAASNRSVLIMGCNTSIDRGVGHVSLLHTPSTGMAWVGLESSAMAISTGSAGNVGAHIVFIDSDHQVDIQVASADTIRIHNAAVSTRTGNVTLVW